MAAAEDNENREFPQHSDSDSMQAIYLENYVKSLDQIKPCLVSRPSFEAYSKNPKNRKSLREPLIHVRITHTAINHVDLLYAHGRHQNNKSGLFQPPFTLGLEFSGIVMAVRTPDNSDDAGCTFRRGDKVWGAGMGTHAEELILPQSAVKHLPQGWSLSESAALGAATIPVSYGALTMIANVKPGETVLVHAAAGGLGVYAVQIARGLGAKVIGTVGSERKFGVVEKLLRGVDGKLPKGEGVVRYDREGWEKKVLEIVKEDKKDGVDVVYDTVGLVAKSIRCTRFNGRVVIVGFAGRTGTGAEAVQELEQVAVNRILLKQIKLLGYRFGETGRRLPEEQKGIWQGLSNMLSSSDTPIKPVIYKTFKGLESTRDAMQALADRKAFGKAIIEVAPETENSASQDIVAKL